MDGPVRVQRIHLASRRGRGLVQVAFFLRLIPPMIRRLRSDRPDVIHAVDLPMLGIALLARPFLGRRVRLVYDAFEIYAVMVAHRFPRIVLRAISAFETRLPRAADLVVTAGESRRRRFETHGIRSIVVPNWIDAPAAVPDRAAAKAALDLPPDRLAIVYAGALSASRDLETLLGHARRFPADLHVIAGTGDREAWLREAAAELENVRFLGWVPDPTTLLAAADVLYYALRPDHPYAAFAAPNNLYVAIAHAVPLVYRPQGELEEVGRSEVIGIPFTDAPSLDAAIDRLRDPAVAEAIRASLADLRRRYTWEAAVEPLVAAYPVKAKAASRASANGP
jgi:glycosyltransferase involved in cell wall biosynthesis